MSDKKINFKVLKEFLRLIRLAGVPIHRFGFSMVLLTCAMLLEGISLGLVIPLFDTLVKKGDYGLIRQIPVLRSILERFPHANFHGVFYALIGGILLATIAKNAFTYCSEMIVTSISVRAEHELRSRIFERYMAFSKSFIDKNKIGSLCDLAFQQVILACDIFYRFNDLLLFGLMSAAYLVIMMAVSWKLTLCSLVVLPPIYLFIKWISKSIVRSGKRRFELDQKMSAALYDALSNISLIHSYTNEGAEVRKYRQISDSGRTARYHIFQKSFLAPRVQEVFSMFAIAGLFALGLFIFKKGKIGELSLLMGFFLAMRRFAMAIGSFGNQFTSIAKALAPVRQVLWLFDDSDKAFIRSGTRRFEGLREVIEFSGAKFSYNGSAVLEDVNLRFEKGKMTALVGPTGSGKTTLVNLVQRFYDVTAGSVRFDGVPIAEFELASLRSRIAVVDQGASILNATIRENIVYGMPREVSAAELESVARKAAIHDFIQGLPEGYGTIVGDRGVRLSGGERQRIAIARAILKDPDIFIFDEATGSLDMETEQLIQKSIEQLTRNRTVIVIAHRLTTIRNADHIIVLEAGRVREAGTLAELTAKDGLFRRHWEMIKF